MAQTDSVRAVDRYAPGWPTGAVAGIIGSVAYTILIEVVNVTLHGAGAFLYPLRQIGAVVLGPGALDASYDPVLAVAVGTGVHLGFAAVFGMIVALAVAHIAAMTAGRLIALGLVAGLALYGLDVFVIFPAAFPWFLQNDRLIQSIGHALFGAVTGAWLGWRQPA